MTDTESEPWRPRARADVVFRRVGDDWLLFDPVSQEIHVLNLPSALAWTLCTGELDVGGVHREMEDAYGEDVPRSRVREILERFRDVGLLAP